MEAALRAGFPAVVAFCAARAALCGGGRRRCTLPRGDVALRILVDRRDAVRCLERLVAQELDRDLVPQLEARLLPEVGKVLTLLLAHVVAVVHVRVDHRGPPRGRTRPAPGDLADRGPDLVVVLDGVLDLLLDGLGVGPAGAEPEQLGVEEPLLGLGVGLEQDREPLPDGGESFVVVARPLLEHREHPPLLVVLVRDHLGDVHGPLSSGRGMRLGPPCTMLGISGITGAVR